jgi:hypothetical protein
MKGFLKNYANPALIEQETKMFQAVEPDYSSRFPARNSVARALIVSILKSSNISSRHLVIKRLFLYEHDKLFCFNHSQMFYQNFPALVSNYSVCFHNLPSDISSDINYFLRRQK